MILCTRGDISDIMIKTPPEIYSKCITVKNKRETVLYVKALNSIYGTMKLELLIYKRFFGYLTTNIFKLNPYNTCVANNIFNVKQMTVV